MEQFDFWGFWIPSVLMGFGIAIDVGLATVTKFRDQDMGWKNWTLPIIGTHILFPAAGYYLFWGLGRKFEMITPVLGVAGFFFVLAFVYEVVCETIGKEPIFAISGWLSGVMGLRENDSRRIIAILAVSWDALWSGPAKAAQALAGNWTTSEVFLSFPLAGVTVAAVAQIALLIAWTLQKKKFESAKQMAISIAWGKYLELSVIGGFGVLSLLQGTGNIYWSVLVAAAILKIVWTVFRRQISESSYREALEAVNGGCELDTVRAI